MKEYIRLKLSGGLMESMQLLPANQVPNQLAKDLKEAFDANGISYWLEQLEEDQCLSFHDTDDNEWYYETLDRLRAVPD